MRHLGAAAESVVGQTSGRHSQFGLLPINCAKMQSLGSMFACLMLVDVSDLCAEVEGRIGASLGTPFRCLSEGSLHRVGIEISARFGRRLYTRKPLTAPQNESGPEGFATLTPKC